MLFHILAWLLLLFLYYERKKTDASLRNELMVLSIIAFSPYTIILGTFTLNVSYILLCTYSFILIGERKLLERLKGIVSIFTCGLAYTTFNLMHLYSPSALPFSLLPFVTLVLVVLVHISSPLFEEQLAIVLGGTCLGGSLYTLSLHTIGVHTNTNGTEFLLMVIVIVYILRFSYYIRNYMTKVTPFRIQ